MTMHYLQIESHTQAEEEIMIEEDMVKILETGQLQTISQHEH